MDGLTAQFHKLNYMNPAERNQARDLVPSVLAISGKMVAQKGKKPSVEEMHALTKLIAASNPYDVESAGVVDLAILAKIHKMVPVYRETAKSLANVCEKKSLEYYMSQQFCEGAACKKIPFPQPFEDCLAKNLKTAK
jgi:hypothetical protein